jgi:hypothetical protein
MLGRHGGRSRCIALLTQNLSAGGGGSMSCPGYTIPEGKPLYPLYRRLGGCWDMSKTIYVYLKYKVQKAFNLWGRYRSIYDSN